MKTLMLSLAAVGAVAAAAPAMAADYVVSGTVNAACSAVGDSTIAFGTIAISSTTGRLTTGQSKSSDAQAVWCNGVAARVNYSGSSMVTTNTTTDAAFTSALSFTPAVTIGGKSFATNAVIGPIAGDLVVSARDLSDGGKLPVAGSYSGTISVTLTPGS